MIVVVDIPIRTVTGLNAREHWRTAHARKVRERSATLGALVGAERWPVTVIGGRVFTVHAPPRVVTFTRVSPRLCDDDNLMGAMKSIRDEIARFFRVDDGPSGPVEWRYEQRKQSRTHGVTVTMEW